MFVTVRLFKALVREKWIGALIKRNGHFYGVLVQVSDSTPQPLSILPTPPTTTTTTNTVHTHTHTHRYTTDDDHQQYLPLSSRLFLCYRWCVHLP